MALVINTNIMSLNAQRNVTNTNNDLATSLQRLSTGLRINSAKDDAAGLGIVDRMTSQIRGLNQAVRNASDGISLSQTAESALGELTNNLQRIRELAVQSANATNSASDRAALDAEVQQRIAEIDRIASQTAFNNQKVLDGSFGTASFQIGANVGETIAVTLNTGVGAGQIGQIAEGTSDTALTATALTAGGLTIKVGAADAIAVGASVDGGGPGQEADSAFAKALAVNAAGVPGLTATAANSIEEGTAFDDVTLDAAGETYSLDINGVTVYSAAYAGSNIVIDAATVADQVNLFTGETGVSASVDATSGAITFSTSDGRNISAADTIVGSTNTGVDTSVQAQVNRGTITLSATDNITLDGGQEDRIGFDTDETITKDTVTISAVNVRDVDAANNALKRIDSALTSVSGLRSQFGAIQNRFESTIANLQAVSENLAASRGRIQDADFAAETAALTRAQILQQAGVSVLAQANAQPQLALSLLQ